MFGFFLDDKIHFLFLLLHCSSNFSLNVLKWPADIGSPVTSVETLLAVLCESALLLMHSTEK